MNCQECRQARETWSGKADFIMQVVRRMQLFSCIADLLVIA